MKLRNAIAVTAVAAFGLVGLTGCAGNEGASNYESSTDRYRATQARVTSDPAAKKYVRVSGSVKAGAMRQLGLKGGAGCYTMKVLAAARNFGYMANPYSTSLPDENCSLGESTYYILKSGGKWVYLVALGGSSWDCEDWKRTVEGQGLPAPAVAYLLTVGYCG
jgi:hypothetical protein